VNVNAQPFSVRRDIMKEDAERIGTGAVRGFERGFHAAVEIPADDKPLHRARVLALPANEKIIRSIDH
jgi:hypothetical protein